MSELDFTSNNLKTLFREIGLYSPKQEFYAERVRKHQQVFAYITQLKSALSKLSTKRPIIFLDCGCGKSYLSFILYAYCQSILKRKIKIIGIDNNPELISKCQKSAQELDFQLEFHATDVEKFTTSDQVDIVYSLHACDTATDQTIAKGVELDARYIFSVSCCQHTNRNNMVKHPLTSVSRYQAYKERLADMLGDTMRALLLENLGYGVRLYEFIAAEYTPKNIMLRAIKNSVTKQDRENAKSRYDQLVKMFNFAPYLEKLLPC